MDFLISHIFSLFLFTNINRLVFGNNNFRNLQLLLNLFFLVVFFITDMIPIHGLFLLFEDFFIILINFLINLVFNFLLEVVRLLITFHAQFLLLLAAIEHLFEDLFFSLRFRLFNAFIFAITRLECRGLTCSNLWRNLNNWAKTLSFWLSTESWKRWEATKLWFWHRWYLDSDKFRIYFRLRIEEAASKVKVCIHWEFCCSSKWVAEGVLIINCTERILIINCLKCIWWPKTAKALHLGSRLHIFLYRLLKCLSLRLFKWLLNNWCKLRLWFILLIFNTRLGLSCLVPALFLIWSSHQNEFFLF